MRKVRAPDLQVRFQHDPLLFIRSETRGVGARVPPPAVAVLALCAEPRERDEVAAMLGPGAARLFEGLADAGLLVDPDEVHDTPVFFENFAAVDVHRRMIADRVRVDAYRDALRAVVRPGMAVLDAGTGSGLLAALAAAAGARVVYAVDRSDLLDLAREVFAASGHADVIRPVRGDFGKVQLPEPVDVIVTETFGALALAEGATDDLRACAARNLAPGGVVIPSRIDLWLAPVGDRALFDETVEVFSAPDGVDLGPLRRLALKRTRNLDLPASALLAPPQRWASLSWPGEGTASGVVRFPDLPEGALVGFAGWFTLGLADGVSLPTGPLDPTTHWGQTYAPIEPMPVRAGASLELSASLSPSDEDRRSQQLRGTFSVGDARGRLDHRVR